MSRRGEGIVIGSLVVGEDMSNLGKISDLPLERLVGIVGGYSIASNVLIFWLDALVRGASGRSGLCASTTLCGGYLAHRFRLVANQPQPITAEALKQLGKDEFTDKMILAAMGITTTEEED